MARNIQLQDDVYARLEAFREKRETFSEAVDRLLSFNLNIMTVLGNLGPSPHLKEHPLGGKTAEEIPQ